MNRTNDRVFVFAAGESGLWRIDSIVNIVGPESLASAPRLDVTQVSPAAPAAGKLSWRLRGVTSNERYVTGAERRQLSDAQEPLGRRDATQAALIPIRKSDAWWKLAQDERREIFEEHSRHLRIGAKYLPAIARRLHHCRDLGTDEPFDFLTWFEYAPGDARAFDDLVAELRSTPEWSYMEREIDIRLVKEPPLG